MKVLGLDTSTSSTGYAVMDTETKKIISYGTIKTQTKADLLDKIIYIEEHIKQIIKAKEVEFIVIEDLAVTRNASTTKALAGLLYYLLVEFRKRELLVVQVRPTQWRSTCNIKARGRKEQKEETIRHVKDVYNLNANDDEADAICIAEYGSKLEVINGK